MIRVGTSTDSAAALLKSHDKDDAISLLLVVETKGVWKQNDLFDSYGYEYTFGADDATQHPAPSATLFD